MGLDEVSYTRGRMREGETSTLDNRPYSKPNRTVKKRQKAIEASPKWKSSEEGPRKLLFTRIGVQETFKKGSSNF